MIHSYPSIFDVTHGAVSDMLKNCVDVEEKVDGSQFSFMVTGKGELECRSSGKQIVVDRPETLFNKAIESARALASGLHADWVYRCEYLSEPKHNTLKYNRVPYMNLILFDINTGFETYLKREDKELEAKRIGLEIVPLLFRGHVDKITDLEHLLKTESVLGGQNVEGVVIKPSYYNIYGSSRKCLFAKLVREDFKEIHRLEWKRTNPSLPAFLDMLGAEYRTEARWNKSIQHLKEKGLLTGTPRDIGTLMKEIPLDVKKECEEEIKEKLWQFAWPKLQRFIIKGFPEYYKELK